VVLFFQEDPGEPPNRKENPEAWEAWHQQASVCLEPKWRLLNTMWNSGYCGYLCALTPVEAKESLAALGLDVEKYAAMELEPDIQKNFQRDHRDLFRSPGGIYEQRDGWNKAIAAVLAVIEHWKPLAFRVATAIADQIRKLRFPGEPE